MVRIKLIIEYDGTNFHGWQRQPACRTVQQELATALTTACASAVMPVGSGRTDAGVHALQQVAHADIPEGLNSDSLLRSLNGLLPADIRALRVEEVSSSWDARFHAIARFYRYRIIGRPTALERERAWMLTRSMEMETLHGCAQLLNGMQDMDGFCIQNPCNANYRTHLFGARWIEVKEELQFFVAASHFYHRMVRRLVGLQIDLASQGTDISRFQETLLHGTGTTPTAPALGLSLVGPVYPEDTDLDELKSSVWDVMIRMFPFLHHHP